MMHNQKEEINSCKTLALHNLQSAVLFASYHHILHFNQSKISKCSIHCDQVYLIKQISNQINHYALNDIACSNIRYPISKVYRNSQHLPLLVEFPNNYFAKRFYDQFNFKKGISDILFIISFDLKLDKQQLKQYELKGTTQTNLRQVFQLARKKSICEISINHESFQPDSAALLTFLRELSSDEQRQFFSELSKLGVTVKEAQTQKQQTGGWWQSCKKIIISNMPNDIYHKNAFDFLVKNDMLDMAKQFSVNRKHKAIKIEFHLPQQALHFYKKLNFNQKIESRFINIFFDISLPETQMKRYQIEGVTAKNLRTIFELALQIQKCKLQLSYGPENNSQLESKAQIIFFSKKDISKHKISFLAKKLQQFRVFLSKQPPNVIKQQSIPILKVQESIQVKPEYQPMSKQKT